MHTNLLDARTWAQTCWVISTHDMARQTFMHGCPAIKAKGLGGQAGPGTLIKASEACLNYNEVNELMHAEQSAPCELDEAA